MSLLNSTLLYSGATLWTVECDMFISVAECLIGCNIFKPLEFHVRNKSYGYVYKHSSCWADSDFEVTETTDVSYLYYIYR